MLFAEAAAPEIDVQQEASGGASLTRLLPWRFPPAESRHFLSVCVRCWVYFRIFQVSRFIRLAFLSFTSEASPQVVAYFCVSMATARGNPSV